MSDKNVNDKSPATDGLTVTNDSVAGEPVEQDAAFLDVDEADVETSTDDSENDKHLFSNTHGEVEPGTDNSDTTVSQLTDALDSDALASSSSPETDATGSER